MRQLIILIFIFHSTFSIAQTLKPAVFNMGGGAGIAQTIGASWSIGELGAIGYFTNSSLQLSLGVLQPNSDVVTSIYEPGEIVFKNQISITPNPSFGIVKAVFNMKVPGRAIITILNSASQLIRKIELSPIELSPSKTIELNELPVGLYFIKVNYYPTIGTIQNGIFKIIRL